MLPEADSVLITKELATSLCSFDDYDVVVVALTCVAKRAACGFAPFLPLAATPFGKPPFDPHSTHSNEASEPET